MKEDIRMMKTSDELNKEEGKKIKTTKLLVKLVEIHKFKKIIYLFNKYKMIKIGAETNA